MVRVMTSSTEKRFVFESNRRQEAKELKCPSVCLTVTFYQNSLRWLRDPKGSPSFREGLKGSNNIHLDVGLIIGAYFSGVGEFVDATERMDDEKKEQLKKGNTDNDPKSSLHPGTFTDDRYKCLRSILNLIHLFITFLAILKTWLNLDLNFTIMSREKLRHLIFWHHLQIKRRTQ